MSERLDVPAGLVIARVRVEGGRTADVTIENVPSFAGRLDERSTMPGNGEITYSVAFGGDYYALAASRPVPIPFSDQRGGVNWVYADASCWKTS